MPTVTTADTGSDLTAQDPTQTYFSRVLLTRAKYFQWFERWAENTNLPQGEGINVIMRRWLHLAMALSPLTQGVPPTGKTPSLDDFAATVAQYGDFIAPSDLLRWTEKDPFMNDWTMLLGEQAGYTIDTVKRNTADAGTNVLYSNGTARTDVVTIPDGNDYDRACRVMEQNGAEKPISGSMSGSNFGSPSYMACYPVVVHPHTMMPTVWNLNGFKSAADLKNAPEGCWGVYKELAFYVAADASSVGAGARIRTGAGGTSSAVRNTSGTADVYEDIVFSRRGFNSIKLSGKSLQNYVKPLGSAGALDPLDQVGTIGWKDTTTQMRTNENWILRVEHACEL